ncbi:uncharacterized protein LOC131884877 [Tigriopus californicus]|uniref:uncharacterized protein LOC131884877 n=1 Tax=Tigriopus californicus TaxID=6832 RepID=UPI0027D9EE0C|nr:uncharacterized protein LOC131884877 [Tigriopus californicus]
MKKKLRQKLRKLAKLRAQLSGSPTESNEMDKMAHPPHSLASPPPPTNLKLNIPLPTSKKAVFDIFTLSKTNQILQGHSPAIADSLSPIQTAKSKRKAKALKGARQWIELVASELFSAQVNVVPKPAEFNTELTPVDPARSRYKSIDEFGTPHAHLCKLVRQHLIQRIIKKHALVQPRVKTNVTGKIPTKDELDQWKLKRARKSEENRRKKRKVIRTKKKKFPSRLRQCRTCGDYHFRRYCGNRDLKINLMVKQIYQKTEIIKETMADAWEKIEALENAYEDMLNKALRIQSNRVCIENLTGEEYPGENHPGQCPCAEQEAKEQLDLKRQEERAQEEQRKRKEDELRKEGERLRREQILEMRKKRFYTRLKQDGQTVVPKKSQPAFTDLVRFKDEIGRTRIRRDSDEATTVSSGILESDSEDNHLKSSERAKEDKVSPWLKAGLNELTRLEASRRRSKLTLMDGFDDPIRKERSLLSKAMAKGFGKELDLIVMDGTVKCIGSRFEEDGGRIEQQLTIESINFDEMTDQSGNLTPKFEDQTPPLVRWNEPEDISLPMSLEPSLSERLEKSVQEETETVLTFNEFLDLMEVF